LGLNRRYARQETMMQLATFDAPRLKLHDYLAARAYVLPTEEESLATPLSDDLVFNWSLFAEETPPTVNVAHLAWDLRRRFGDKRGLEMFRPIAESWSDADVKDLWAAADRPKCETDQLIIYELAALHNDDQLLDLICPDEGEAAVRREVEGLGKRFDASNWEAVDGDAITAKGDARRAEQVQMRDAAESEWLAFRGAATAEQVDAWNRKYARNIIPFRRKLEPVAILPFPAAAARLPDLLVSSADFIAAFVPAEYLIDGIVQRRYFYSMTAQTGVGKTSIAMRWMAHVVAGHPIGDKEVQQGEVLYFAGENPDDVRARWLVLSREMGIDPETDKVTWIVGAKDLNATAQQISAEVATKGLNLAYVVIDTAAAYNVGDDENSNTQAGNYARQLRSLTNLPGGPCVVVLCHPTKRAADDDLMPRGGGAFLAEVDGNMAVLKKDSLLVLAPFGKFRGDTSWSLRYEIEIVKDHPRLKDARGRQMNSVVARPVGDGASAILEKRTDADMETVLAAVDRTPSATPTDLARALGWTFGLKAEPNVNRVKRNLTRLQKDKLVKETLGKWRTTSAGEKELNAIDKARAAAPKPMFPVPFVPPPG
jgi:AAA domain-containing protein